MLATTGISSVSENRLYSRRDWLNVGILIILFGLVLLLVPPAHIYSVTDDWAYAHSVQDMITWNYKPSEWSMAIALSHVAWGSLFVWLFGFSFTVLTASNLVMSLAGIILFYLLLRQLNVLPSFALFGAAVLFLNPMYIYLSYSYMSDVPFTTYSTSALLCYVIGVKRQDNRGAFRWLVGGSFFASLAYLDRQLGALLLVGIVIYLVWRSPRRIQFGRIIASVLLPCVAIISYMLWERSFHVTLPAYVQSELRSSVLSDLATWIQDRILLVTWNTFLLGLILIPLLSFQNTKRKLIRLLSVALPFVAIFFLLDIGYATSGSWVPHNIGNILDSTGFLMQQYDSASLFNDNVWLLLAVVSALAISILIATIAYRLARWKPVVVKSAAASPVELPEDEATQADEGFDGNVIHLGKKGPTFKIASPRPQALVFLFGLMIFVVTASLSYVTTDRYWLPMLPALIVFAVTSIGASRDNVAQSVIGSKSRPSILRWGIVGVMAIVTLVGQKDYMAHATARWEAGEQLLAQGVPADHIYTGIEWSGWYLSDEGVQYFRNHGNTGKGINPAEAVIDPVYLASDKPIKGYTIVSTWEYPSLLRGGQGQVFIFKRDSDISTGMSKP